jgi:hypothetical protein
MCVGGQLHAPAALPSRKETLYPLCRRLGGPQCRSGRVRKSRPHRDFFFSFSFRTLSVLSSDCSGFAFCPYCTTHITQTFMPLARFEPAIPASDRPQTLALDRYGNHARFLRPKPLKLISCKFTNFLSASFCKS